MTQRGRNVSIFGAISCYGIVAVIVVEGPVDAAVFCAYIGHVLASTLRPGDIVIMDNLSVQKVQGIEAMIAAARATLV